MTRRIWTMALFATLVLFAAGGSTPVLAQGEQPPNESQSLIIFTRYPAQEAAIGDNVTFDLSLRADAPQTVRLEVQNLPKDWRATFRGGGKVIRAAYVEPGNDTSVSLGLELSEDVQADTYRFSVIARGESKRAELPIELTVKEKLPPSLEFELELPTLRGTPSTTFRYNATLKNKGDEDLSVNLVADAPPAFQVTFKLAGQDVTSIPIAANASKRLSIEAQAFAEVPAGAYPINVLAQGGEAQATMTLTAEVTGQAELAITTPDGRLSDKAYAGDETPLTLVVQNTGSAPAHNVELSASSPTGWSVEFEPKQIAEIPSDQQIEVTANIQPAEQAVAGDYVITIHARPEKGTTKSAEFRITVLTSTLWGVVGIAFIAVAVVIVGLAVMRFGRR